MSASAFLRPADEARTTAGVDGFLYGPHSEDDLEMLLTNSRRCRSSSRRDGAHASRPGDGRAAPRGRRTGARGAAAASDAMQAVGARRPSVQASRGDHARAARSSQPASCAIGRGSPPGEDDRHEPTPRRRDERRARREKSLAPVKRCPPRAAKPAPIAIERRAGSRRRHGPECPAARPSGLETVGRAAEDEPRESQQRRQNTPMRGFGEQAGAMRATWWRASAMAIRVLSR